jgi:hypothetical protein
MDNIDKSFVPTREWMAEKYDEMNKQLFGGRLMECGFEVFTKGAGMEGGTLGWFCITGRNIRIKRGNRRIFQQNGWSETYVDRDNFVSICRPVIKLNGNYHGTEHGFLATLVHEMCHYYTYMDGYAPVQGHGREFREIGAIVSARSNGMFSIQRLATAEEMQEMSLNADMKAKRQKRLANKKASVSALLAITSGGDVKLTISSNDNLLNMIKNSEEERGSDVFVSNDTEVIEYLFNKGFKKNMRSWRYWNLKDKPWLDELKKLFGIQTLGVNTHQEIRPAASRVAEPKAKRPKRIFTIRTNSGVFEVDVSGEDTPQTALVMALKERFPKMSIESIRKIINNPANYRMEENRITFSSIVEGVINELMDDNDSVEITPDMNLGLKSPIEGEI